MTTTLEASPSAGLDASPNAAEYLRRKYLLRDRKGNVVESPEGMFSRVSRVIASAEGKSRAAQQSRKEFYGMLSSFQFLPSSPMLMSAGTSAGQFSSVYVVPYASQTKTSRDIRTIQAAGGGVGLDVSSHKGSLTDLTTALKGFDDAVHSVLQCGRRRGCNMAVMRVDHPLARQFLMARKSAGLTNTGTSVLLTDEFMEAACNGESFDVQGQGEPRNDDAAALLDAISLSTWKCGEPGVIFVDEVNRTNPVPHLGRIDAVSPCAVAPLLPYESCMLGSLNLLAFARSDGVDFDALRITARLATRFLDDAITVNPYPNEVTRKAALRTRKIGIGVMGLADILASQRIPYGTRAARDMAEKIIQTIGAEATLVSEELAKERGPYPAWNDAQGTVPRRNATLTAIAPTGSICVIAGCWGGIEPYYGAPSVQRVLDDLVLTEMNPVYSALSSAPEKARFSLEEFDEVFKSAWEIPYQDQVLMVATIQKHVDNAVAKTVTLEQSATPEDVRDAIVLAWKTKCKGVSLFRVGSIDGWILRAGS
jgi:ribonucleoside-diphosphate reductase alpha chain